MDLGGIALDTGLRSLAWVARRHPTWQPARWGVDVLRDLVPDPARGREHWCDVYRPMAGGEGLPLVVYVHGGSFRLLSKDSHFAAGLRFAAEGAVVVVPNYPLAPKHPFPEPLEAVLDAVVWARANATSWGADPERLVLAGESAGANLATAATLALIGVTDGLTRAPIGGPPKRLIASMGLLQTSDPGRFARRRPIGTFLDKRIRSACTAYHPNGRPHPLADPLLTIESDTPLPHFPPTHVAGAIRDALLDDSRRLRDALTRRGLPCQWHIGDGIHAYHFLPGKREGEALWRELTAFATAS